MQLRNSFSVPAPPDEAFTALLDLNRVAPCMPGARLTGVDGDTYTGELKLRVGPITAAYAGSLTIEHADSAARTARLSASGQEIGGQGAASATVTATVSERGEGSDVEVVTDLDIRGKVAQFGRGALGEVTQRVLDQFARNLEASFTSTDGHGEAAAGAAAAASPVPTGTPAADAGDLDVLSTVVGPLARRALPAVIAFVIGALVGRLLRPRGPQAAPPAGSGPYPWSWGPPPWWAAPPRPLPDVPDRPDHA